MIEFKFNIFQCIIFPVVYFLLAYILYRKIQKTSANFGIDKENPTRKLIKWLYFVLVILVFLFIEGSGGFSWRISPAVWGNFGSFIGAILLAATLLYQIRSFRRQQVENKFFEMVRYYRNNIQEMKFRNPFYYINEEKREVDEEFVTGRRVIKTIFEQYKVAVKLITNVIENENNLDFRSKNDFYSKKEKEWESLESDLKPDTDYPELIKWNKRLLINNLSYLITFWGIPLDVEDELNSAFDDEFSKWTGDAEIKNTITKELLDKVKQLVTVYEFEGKKKIYSGSLKNKNGEIKPCEGYRYKIKFFGGHQYQLGHFFRHLYRTVKYIDEQPLWLVSQKDKEDYVSMLRAQMSNYEQALLFINSLSNLGTRWEYAVAEKMISKYDLIRNLPQYFIPSMNPKYFYPEVHFEWKFNEADKEQRELGLK